jgi:hypothetical protein
MFNPFKKPAAPPPSPPDIRITRYDHGTIGFTCEKELAPGASQEVVATLFDGSTVPARVLVESYNELEKLYWGKVEEPADLGERLVTIVTVVEEEPVPTWEEKRAVERLPVKLGMMSPVVAGFKALSFDLTPVGVRMMSPSELPVGKVIKFRLELDDARLAPLEMKGEVLWCAELPKPTQHERYWGGIRFDGATEEQTAMLVRFIEETRQHEAGVLGRDYE